MLLFQRWRVLSSLGYLLVSVLRGPPTPSPVVPAEQVRPIAGFGIVFAICSPLWKCSPG